MCQKNPLAPSRAPMRSIFPTMKLTFTVLAAALVLRSRAGGGIVSKEIFQGGSQTKLLMPEGTWEPVDSYPLKCPSNEFSCTQIKNTTRFYEFSASRNLRTVDVSTIFKPQNVTFVGDSYSRALHGAFICLLESMNFSLRLVNTSTPCEGAQCTWEHGVRMHRVSSPHLSEHFFVAFIWSPFLAKVSLREVYKKGHPEYKRLVIIDTSVFLGGQKSALLHDMHRTGGLCIIYAEHHWQYRTKKKTYAFWDENSWMWVAPSPLVQQRARETAIRELDRLRGLKTVEITEQSGTYMMRPTYLLPESVLIGPPVEHRVQGHWCTEMITYSVLLHILKLGV